MIEIRRQDTDTTCAVCGRTVLLGERLVSFRRIGLEDAMVCELCVDQADARGWTRQGAPALPVQLAGREERGLRGLLREITAAERKCRDRSGGQRHEECRPLDPSGEQSSDQEELDDRHSHG